LDKQHHDTFDKRIPGQLPTYRLDHYTSCGPIQGQNMEKGECLIERV